MRVFLSYRRADSAGYAGRLAESLARRGVDVFRDVTAIEGGIPFMEAIREGQADAAAIIVMIGPQWGAAFRGDDVDYVLQEIETALALQRPIFPVLVGGAPMPSSSAVPIGVAPVLQINAIVIGERTWDDDVERLARRLRGAATLQDRSDVRPILSATALMGVLAVDSRWPLRAWPVALVATAAAGLTLWAVVRPTGRVVGGRVVVGAALLLSALLLVLAFTTG